MVEPLNLQISTKRWARPAKNTGIVNSTTGSKISELGSGIQQAVTIGLLEKTCISRSRTSIILMEEPETFLHPNAQREIYLKLCSLAKRPSTQLVFTTHSPAILDATEISNICVIRKTKDHGSDNIVSKILQVRNADSVTNRRIVDDVELRKTFENSNVFFSELVVFVEGFSDELVLREALKKLAPHLMYRVSVVNCHGNTKFLTMIKFLENFKSESGHKIEWLIMCDKDSLRKGPIDDFKSLSPNLDWNYIDVAAASPIVTKDTAGNFNRNSVRIITGRLNRALEASRVRIFEADIEFALVTDANLAKACEQIRSFHQRGDATLNRFKSLDQVAMLIGSKGPNFNWQLDDENRKRWKRPELHRAIAASFKEADFSEDIKRAIRWIEQALSPTA